MSTLRRLVHGRVDPADHRLLKHEADVRGISQTKCVGDIIREYVALRKEMLSVINSAEAPGEAHVGLLHSLVARMEGRLAVLLSGPERNRCGRGDQQTHRDPRLTRVAQASAAAPAGSLRLRSHSFPLPVSISSARSALRVPPGGTQRAGQSPHRHCGLTAGASVAGHERGQGMKMLWVWLEFLLATALLLALLTAPAWAQRSGVADPHSADRRIAASTPLPATAAPMPDRGGCSRNRR